MATPQDSLNVEHRAAVLTCRHAKRVKAVAVAAALGSWLLPIAVSLGAASSMRPYAVAGLSACAASWGISLVLAWRLYCPWCCERLFFASGVANSPGWRQLARQFVPYETVVHGRLMCPHCRSRFALSDG
ncbi:MAG TPA: hypothetical protein VFY73_12865 [Ideonella sp.]|uniref:hypothetical protein n=1 Tax=Ideonella sp. TaxID=1929293 RepID=UPI002E325587|nr:hypothetical protein [Ideonella sp.]HEX5684908.1 hypothetical protein [Ideonella sp.]